MNKILEITRVDVSMSEVSLTCCITCRDEYNYVGLQQNYLSVNCTLTIKLLTGK